MTNREKLLETFLAFLEYCQSGSESDLTAPIQPGFAAYPIGITAEQIGNARKLGVEVMKQMPDSIVNEVMERSGATGHIMKVFPTDGEPYTQYNDRNAGYVVYNLIFMTMYRATGGDLSQESTLAIFKAEIHKVLRLEFPKHKIPEKPDQQEPLDQQETEILPTLDEIKPKKAIIPHTIIASSLTLPEPWGGEWKQLSLPGFPIHELNNKHATTYFSMEWDAEGSGITTSRKVSLHDKSVMNAVINIFEAGNEIFSARQVCSGMKGAKNDKSGIDESTLAKVERSIEKQRRIMARINATETFTKRGIMDYDAEIETYLLPVEKIKVQGKGKRSNERITAYRFIKEPPVLTHAKAIDQIYTVPITALQTGKISATDSVVILRDFLLSRIEAARGGKLNRKILYSSVYDKMELLEPSRYSYEDKTDEKTGITVTAEEAYKKDLHKYQKQTATIRKNMKALLDNWQQQGHIDGYTESKKGKTMEGVTLFFKKKG